MAAMSFAPSRSGATVTVARFVARLTLASATPGTFLRTRSTRPTQAAQVMPSMSRSWVMAGASLMRSA
jgi:hypothetical protein